MKIKDLIISKIKKKGQIDVGEFIELCQFSENGYYINKICTLVRDVIIKRIEYPIIEII